MADIISDKYELKERFQGGMGTEYGALLRLSESHLLTLLEGVRGERPSDMPAIADCLLRLSQLVTSHPRIKELDINPLIVYPRGQGAMVADARIILE